MLRRANDSNKNKLAYGLSIKRKLVSLDGVQWDWWAKRGNWWRALDKEETEASEFAIRWYKLNGSWKTKPSPNSIMCNRNTKMVLERKGLVGGWKERERDGAQEGALILSFGTGLGSCCVANGQYRLRPLLCSGHSYHAHFVLSDYSFIQGDMHLALRGQNAPAPT